jgi:membrane protein DedA with SNARE-associated domain
VVLTTFTSVTAILVALVLGGLGAPIPEDLPLLSAGYLASRGDVPLWLLLVASVGGICVSDGILYLLGRRFGPGLLRWRWLKRHLPERLVERLTSLYAKRGPLLVLVARLAVGMRAAFFFAAGAANMRARRFVLYDLAGAAVAAGVWMYLGLRLASWRAASG